MKTVLVENAVGTVLAHDLTQIIPGEFKGSRFQKGHVVEEPDIPVLLSMGKKHLFVLELGADDVHEDDAARRIAAAAAGANIDLLPKGEGKVELRAACDGLLKIDVDKLEALIEDDEVMFAAIHENVMVRKGEQLAGTRVIPLFVKEAVVRRAESVGPFVEVKPLRPLKVGLVTTGSEIYHHLIEDKFGDILRRKFEALGSTVFEQLFADDDDQMIADCIGSLQARGADLIAVTGGMSVDPDDLTPTAIRQLGAEIITHGVPAQPGNMTLVAYLGDVPILGVPGAAISMPTTIFDVLLPQIYEGDRLTHEDLIRLGDGGLCRLCKPCHFPNCTFGRY